MKVRILAVDTEGRAEVAAVAMEQGEVVCRRTRSGWEPLYKLAKRREPLPTDYQLPPEVELVLEAAELTTSQEVGHEFEGD